MNPHSVRRLYYVAFAILIGYFFLVPGQRPIAVIALALLTAATVVYGANTQRSPRRAAWLTLAAAVLVLSIGYLIDVATRLPPAPHDYPLPPNAFYLLSYLPLTAGLLWLGRPARPSRDVPTILDTAALTLVAALVGWILVVRPQIMALHLSTPGKVTAIATWVGFLAVLSAGLRVVLAWRMNLALASVSLGVLTFLAAAFLYGMARVDGNRPDPNLVGLGLLAFCGFLSTAALTPSMATVASAPFARYRLGPWRFAMLAGALLVAPATLLVQAASGAVTTALAIAVVSSTAGLLILIRLVLAIRGYRLRAARDRAVLFALRALVVATSRAEVESAIATAFSDMLPGRTASNTLVEDEERPGPSVPADAVETPVAGPDGLGELRIPLDPPREHSEVRRWVRFAGPPADLVELSGFLHALTGQAGSALARIDLMLRLRIEERERYFRTLVLTSTDVILICRQGRIEYATPSAYAMFGRDVIGEQFDDVVEHRADGGNEQLWSDTEVGTQGHLRGPDGADVTVQVRRRDLLDDPTVHGVVTTLRDVTREQELQRGLAHRATHDPLTGLANPELFRAQLRAARDDVGRHGMYAALFIDLDDFKLTNDRYGHEVGDGLLVTVARRIQSCLSGDDLPARLGGDEFAVLLRRLPNGATARTTAGRIADTLAGPATIAGVDLTCPASIGLAVAHTPADIDTLLRRADTALYTAKADGKGRWREYQDGMATPGRRTTDLRHALEGAIRDQALSLHYQPIVELSTGQAAGFEALVHFDRVTGPAMQPEEFLAIAEDDALTVSLGDWLLRTALADIALINQLSREAGYTGPPRYVSVNISPRQMGQPGFAEAVRAHLSAVRVESTSLVIEVTESLAPASDEAAWSVLAALRRHGIRVAIDGYGTGYASVSYLRQAAIDIVKTDRSLLYDLASPRPPILLEAVVQLVARLGLDQVAEGVEDEQARDLLRSLGCRYGQGRLYAPAMPATEAGRWRAHGHGRSVH